MKKCPNCDRTFDDKLKFCQADGTPLVAAVEPPDPYKTMVANQADLEIPGKEEAEAPQEPAEAPVAAESKPPAAPDEEDVLEVPKVDEEDPLKTMVAGSNTSDSIKVDIPEEKPKESVAESAEDTKESEPAPAPPDKAPEPPKFDEPKVDPPEFTGALSESEGEDEPVKTEAADAPPPSPFTSDSDAAGDEPSAPIPSPFDESMPPGYAPPSTPPFDPSEPVKAEKVASTAPAAEEPKPDFAEPELEPAAIDPAGAEDRPAPPAPIESSTGSEIAGSSPVSGASSSVDGQSQGLAIGSLVVGVLSCLCCLSILTGPAAVIMGFMAKSKVDQDPENYGGKGFAIGGIIAGILGTLLGIVIIALQFLGAFANSF